jgi:hypothetical protein
MLITPDELRAYLRLAIDRAGSQRRWCDEHRAHASMVSEILRGLREPTAQIADALGYRRVILFEAVAPMALQTPGQPP